MKSARATSNVPAGVGIRFNRLDRAQRSKLHALVKQFIAQRQATIPPPPQRSPWALAAVALSAVALVAAGVFALHGLPRPAATAGGGSTPPRATAERASPARLCHLVSHGKSLKFW